MEHWVAIGAERRALADQLETLTPTQWAAQSLCGAWTVRDVAAHLVVPHKIGLPRFLLTLIRVHGNFNRANEALAAREAAHSTAEIIADIRTNADGKFTPPGFGSVAPLTDVLVGLRGRASWPVQVSEPCGSGSTAECPATAGDVRRGSSQGIEGSAGAVLVVV